MSRTTSCKAVRIAAVLRERLARGADGGAGAPAAPFPSARELAGEFGVSRRTADRAVRLLADEGLLNRIPGAGTYLAGVKRVPRLVCLQSLPTEARGRGAEQRNGYVAYCHGLLTEEIKRCRCECSFICIDDLFKRHFSANLWKNYDGLLAHHAYSDIHSRQLIAEFPGPVAWFGPVFPLLAAGTQALPDFMPPMLELLHRARREGMKRCHFCFHNRRFGALYREAATLGGFAAEECGWSFLAKLSLENAAALGRTLDADCGRTVFFCDSDELASGLYLAFRERGLRGGEFHVVGVGDMESLGFRLLGDGAHLTSFATDRRLLIRETLKLLLRQIESGSNVSQILRIPAAVVYRDSAFGGTGKKHHSGNAES